MAASNIAILTAGITAGATINQFQAVTAAGAVATAAGNAVGFANTGAASGERVPVTVVGTAIATAGAAIVVGAAVEVGTAGKVVTRSAGVTVGRALTAAGADGDQIEVLVIGN